MPDCFKKVPLQARDFIMKMRSCRVRPDDKGNIVHERNVKIKPKKEGEEPIFVHSKYFMRPDDGMYRPTAEDMLKDEWLVGELDKQIEKLILGNIEVVSEDDEMAIYGQQKMDLRSHCKTFEAL